MVTIENSSLKVEISELGAEIKSIFDKENKKDLFYDGSGSWKHSDHVLFPFIGPDSGYQIEGKEYSCPTQHGFVRTSTVKVEKASKDQVTMSLESNPDTLKVYPYKFRLTIEYILKKKSLTRKYTVTSLDREDMPFMIGDHPAYKVDYSKAEFHFNKSVLKYLPRPNLILQSPVDLDLGINYKPSKEDFKKYETLVLVNDGIKFSLNNGLGTNITFNFSSPYIAIWSSLDEKDQYICVEPWWGLPPYQDMPDEVKDRKNINIAKGEMVFSDSVDFS